MILTCEHDRQGTVPLVSTYPVYVVVRDGGRRTCRPALEDLVVRTLVSDEVFAPFPFPLPPVDMSDNEFGCKVKRVWVER